MVADVAAGSTLKELVCCVSEGCSEDVDMVAASVDWSCTEVDDGAASSCVWATPRAEITVGDAEISSIAKKIVIRACNTRMFPFWCGDNSPRYQSFPAVTDGMC